MNIIRIDNVKSVLATTYSLTLNIEKYKDLEKQTTIVILDEEDIGNKNTIIKLKGVAIDILVIPKKFKFTFNETEYHDIISTQLSTNYNITYY